MSNADASDTVRYTADTAYGRKTVTIGALARLAGIRPSAIRYYERLGVIPAPLRRSGRRDYDPDAVAQLAVVQFALSAGFSLRDARHLVRGFSRETSVDSRWRELAAAKTKELDALIERANAMKALLDRMSTNCRCDTLVQCGRGLARDRSRWAVDAKRGSRKLDLKSA
jgi:MerR family redox-sensitive transcriptional activator SoxR